MQVCYDGHFLEASALVLTADNRGFKYGDGIFETARVANGSLLLAHYHVERITNGLQLLQIRYPQDFTDTVHRFIIELCTRNGCAASARVRLALFRGADSVVQYLIEAIPIEPRKASLPQQGWVIDIYKDAIKACDSFSHLKSASYLPYVMAGRYAAQNAIDECLLLNQRKTIADGSRTNLFTLIDQMVYTPPLSAGGVHGVMRRHVIERLGQLGYVVREEELDVVSLHQASEVFVTNAIEGVRWVKSYGSTFYGNNWINNIYPQLFEGI